jgi:pyruvate kinase
MTTQIQASLHDDFLPVSGDTLRQLESGDCLRFRDARGAARFLKVASVGDSSCWAEARQTCYLVAGTELHFRTGIWATQVLESLAK